MFITCQECNTIFRLDESLLKPTGSKVRCSLCRHTFIAKPMHSQAPVQTAQATSAPASSLVDDVAPVVSSASSEGVELEGIDLDELDSILADDDVLGDDEADFVSSGNIEGDISALENDLDDIDIDFDAALGNDESQIDISDSEAVSDEIDLDMNFDINDDTIVVDEDMADFDIDSLTMEDDEDIVPGKEAAKSEPSLEDDLAMALGDIDLSLEEEGGPAARPAAGTEEVQDNLDLENFDFELEEEGASASPDGQEEGMGFEDELELNLEDDAVQTPPQEEPEPSLEDELELSLEDEAVEAGAEQSESGLSFEDDFDLNLEDEPAEAELDQAEPELSLGDDFGLLEDEPAEKTAETADTDLSFDDDFELDLEEEAPAEAIEMAAGQESELSLGADEVDEDIDLDDLDSLLESAEEKAGSDSDAADEGAFQMGDDLAELELDMEPETAESDSLSADNDLEELDFDLDSDFDETPSAADAPVKEAAGGSTDEDEIDLSDIEEMLEGGDTILTAKPALEPVVEEDLGFGSADDFDLAEIETAIDEADTIVDMDRGEVLEDQELSLAEERQSKDTASSDDMAEEIDAGELDLDLSLESESAEAQDSEELDFDLDLELADETKEPAGGEADLEDVELDLSDLGMEEKESKEVKERVIESGDIELDFQIGEEAPVEEGAATTPDSPRTEKREMVIPDFGSEEQTLETLAVEEKPRKAKARKPVKKKSRKSLGLVFFLLLLAAIAGGLYYAVMVMGIDIPYVSEYLKPAPKDTSGTVNLSTLNINSKFVENSQGGRLFVITGKVHNGYGQERIDIKLEGRLYVKGKKLVKKETSYAGVIISDQELAELPIAQINQRLNTPPSPQSSTGVIRPGQNVPFMVVFDDLPPASQLDEFAIEPISSTLGR